MWDTSERYRDAIRGGIGVELNVDAYRGGIKLNTDPLPVEPGSAVVTVDGGSGRRRTITLRIGDASLRPVFWTDMLAPAGTELVVTSGVRYPDTTVEYVPVGVFRITEPDTPFDGAVEIHGADRSQVIDDDEFIAPFQTITTNTVTQEITRIIQLSLPTAVISDVLADTTVSPRMTWEANTSPWAAVLELATSISADVAPDASGVFVIRRQPTPSDAPVWTAAVGEAGIVVDGSETMTRDTVKNAWTCKNDAADGTAPVQYTAYDLDPDSPTNWNGDFGHKPDTYSSPALTTISKCKAAAESKLLTSTAPARQVSVDVVPNPAVDYGDVTVVVLPDHSSITAMVQSFTLPLDVDGAPAMQCQLVTNIAPETTGPVVPPILADITTYTPHSSIASTTKYQVTVNGQPSFVYSTYDNASAFQPHWGKFTTFSMGTGQAAITITTDYDVTSCMVRPSIQGVTATIVTPRQISLVINQPGNYSVEPNANPAQTNQTLAGSTDQIDPLFIFASPLETKPSPSDPNVYAYFSEGQVYTGSSVVPGNGSTTTVPASGDLVVPSNKTVYVEGGAVFKGRIICGASTSGGAAASGITVDGRGIVDATWQATPGNPIKVYKCSSSSVSYIVGLSCNKWALRVFGCTGTLGSTGVLIKSTRTFSWADKAKAGTPTPDGMDCVGSTGVTFDGFFVRSRDDGITMKNYTPSAFDGGTWDGNCHDNLVENFVVWNGDAGNGLEIGWETGASTGGPYEIYNITYQHGDVIHKTTNAANTDVGLNVSRGAISIHNQSTGGTGGNIHDIRYEDIRIEDVIGDNTNTIGSDGYIYFNSASASTATHDIYLKDVSVFYSQASLAIQVRGASSSDKITDVTFENCTVNGVVLTTGNAAANGYVHTAGNDANILFIPSQSGGGGGTSSTLAPTADAWVRNNGTAGNDTTLLVKNSPSTSVQRRSYLKFDATSTGLTSCTSAVLRVWLASNDSGADTGIGCYAAVNDTWTETGITWGNQPGLGTLLDTQTAGSQAKYVEWTVTAFVNTQLAGDKVSSFALWDPTSTDDNKVTFNSGNAAGNTPQLILVP